MSQTDPNAASAAAYATMPDALALRELTVIGVIDTANGAAALLRSSRGRIAKVGVGSQAFGVTINAIGHDQVILTERWGRTQALSLPS